MNSRNILEIFKRNSVTLAGETEVVVENLIVKAVATTTTTARIAIVVAVVVEVGVVVVVVIMVMVVVAILEDEV